MNTLMNAIHTAAALFAKRRAGTRGSSGRPGNLRFRNAALLEPQEAEPALDVPARWLIREGVVEPVTEHAVIELPVAQAIAPAAARHQVRIAQSMAREYGPLGIHVAHVVIDGGIDGERVRKGLPEFVAERGDDGLLAIDAIAETYWHIHRQPRSAWAQEIDLRPFKETF
jgi:hypothetical protein